MSAELENICVIGAGAWGTALAQVFARAGNAVTLYARDRALADAMAQNRENKKYLPGVALHPNISVTAETHAIAKAGVIVLVTPAQHLRAMLENLAEHITPGVPLVNGAKGIEITTGKLLHEVVADILPKNPYAVLSGPTFAHEVAQGLPTAITFGMQAQEDTARALALKLSEAAFRPYISYDVTGVEVAGALKNVIAIACGIVKGRRLGENARAAVMTRGMAEIKRFGLARGARAETFLGLSGIGDLTLTCHSQASRNHSLGLALSEGKKLSDILSSRNSVAEGVATAQAVARIVDTTGIDMPISLAVHRILHEGLSIERAMEGLLSRDLRDEAF